ncbi:hypothetical protein GTW29_09280 [Streptomyces sp. SID7834]|nr:hypothetical protein [Streptomyces sp. SID7834]MYT56915.1 hypothetical protein [Streptomyces sp. SID7834]
MSAHERLLAALRGSPELRPGEAEQLIIDNDVAVLRTAAAVQHDAIERGVPSEAPSVGRYLIALIDPGAEKDTRGSVPRKGESTHPAPCEFPEVLPCSCPVRPRVLPDGSSDRARRRSRIGGVFVGARWARSYLSAVGR